ADADILYRRIDGDGTDATDQRALVETIAADNASAAFGNYAVKTGSGEQHREQTHRGFGPGHVRRKAMLATDGGERVVADFAADGGVGRSGAANFYFRLRRRRHVRLPSGDRAEYRTPEMRSGSGIANELDAAVAGTAVERVVRFFGLAGA